MRELPLSLQLDGDEPLYIQIYRGIRDEIMNGAILTGEKLPSARNLAASLQVSRTTVDEAYSQLVSEGYVESQEKKGYFVIMAAGIPIIIFIINCRTTTDISMVDIIRGATGFVIKRHSIINKTTI